MLYNVEVVLRERDYAVTEHVHHNGNHPSVWTELDVEGVLKSMLLAIDRVKNPARKATSRVTCTSAGSAGLSSRPTVEW